MKKLFAILALVLGMVSCQTEPEGLDVVVGGEQDVNITVSLPEGTRADSALGAFDNVDLDNQYDVRFQCEVHYGDQVKVLPVQISDKGKSATFPVRLIANRNYTFVVWADLVVEDTTVDLHYNTSAGLHNITINDWAPMDETRDAFTCSEVREFKRNANITLELTRPFAKLRVITTDMLELMGVKPTWATVVYTTPYYTSFNAYEQKPGDLSSGGKAHSELFDIVSYGESGESKTLFTDYFFAINPENGQAPETVAFTMEVFDENGATIDEPKTFNTSIPVKRNYLTTIKGNILTYADDFTVTIEDAFDNAGNEDAPYHQAAVTNGADLLKAISEGREVIALNNIVVTEADKNFKEKEATRAGEVAINPVLNLNGFKITFVNDTDEPLITIAEGSSLTIVDEEGTGAIVLEGTGTGAAIENNGTLNIEGGSVGSNNGTVIVNNGEANIEGGELKAGAIQNDGNTNVAGGKINEDAITDTENGTTSITGGEFTYTPDADEVTEGFEVKTDENGNCVVVESDPVAKIGEVEYTTLKAAFEAVEDGQTIVLIADVVTRSTAVLADGKTAVLNLNGKTITATDYAIENYGTLTINGDGTINGVVYGENGTTTVENGTFNPADGGKYVFLNSQGGTLTINGGTINGGSSYPIYSYDGNSRLVINDVTVNATFGCVNAYGTNGSVVINGGTFQMTGVQGKTSHIAYFSNVDATINGGTFEKIGDINMSAAGGGGICAIYGAKLTINGGNFAGDYADVYDWGGKNANGRAVAISITGGTYTFKPSFVAEGYKVVENNGRWTVVVDPVAKIGNEEYASLQSAIEAVEDGETITLIKDVTLAEELEIPAGITLNGNGKQINGSIAAGGDLTFAGHTKVTAFSASYYDHVITIGEGACLEVTGGGRVSLAYGNIFNITGSIENAKTADKASIQPSLIIPAGISITGGNNATMNVTNAYVQIGSTTSKPGAAGGLFTFNFDNSIAEFTKEFGFYNPTGGKNPTFVMNIENSVFTTGAKLCVAAANSTITVDNSTVTLGTYLRNSGTINLTNGSVMTGSTIQFGENGGNDGTITVDNSSFSINCGNSTGHAFDGLGTGSITATNSATVAVQYYKDMTINVDATSTFTGTDIYGNRKIHYVSDEMKLEPTNPDALGGAVIVSNVWDKTTGKGVITFDRDLTIIGDKAFQRVTNATPSNWATSITLPASVTSIGDYAFAQCYSLTTITIPDGVTTIGQYAFQSCDAVTTVTIGSQVSTIGSSAFYNCYEIKEFNCKSTTPPALADKWVFNGVDKTATVYVPAASVDTYKNAEVWRNFTNIVGK